ncbi:MAG: ATP-dependent DNA helicase RecG [Oscillospiraceae bacterium]|nr:ATP-dependent DNA helicase RecG [Oscillospiraceae bacterium]
MKLSDDIKYLKGVGPKRAELFSKMDIHTVRDLLYHLPRSYTDFSSPVSIEEAVLDEVNILKCRAVAKHSYKYTRRGMQIFQLTFTDGVDEIFVSLFNQGYLYDKIRIGEDYFLIGKVSGTLTERTMSGPNIVDVSEAETIRPIYPLTEGMTENILRSCMKTALTALDNETCEVMPPEIIAKTGLMQTDDALRYIHFPRSQSDVIPARKRLAFDELTTLQLGMLSLKDRNRTLTPYVMRDYPLAEFYRSLPFEPTGAQRRAISECVSDMTKNVPMNRLIMGDVGSGKTVVAAACCLLAHMNGTQSCLMAPTEVLADQHAETLSKFLEPLGVKVALLKGSMSTKDKNQVRKGLANGEYSVAVGTHALFQKGTEFRNLSLVITDEQHRFGVNQRDALAEKGINPHRLVMSATPIPRTLALMIYGELDISVLDEMPKGRLKIETYAVTGKLRTRAYNFVKNLLNQGRQAYIICPAIDEEEGMQSVIEYAERIKAADFKDYSVGVLHGKMKPAEKESVMADFKDGKIQVLVSTTVVEVGVDVPNAAVMLVENADRFGLSQLHQLRGRVGRGEHQSYCILITDNVTETSKKRLKALASTSDGFEISELDLELRGPGDFFGDRQHGLPSFKIADIAADTDILKLARTSAEEIYASGYLETEEGKGLKANIEKLWEDAN